MKIDETNSAILLNDQYNLLNFYTEEVSKIKDIQFVETFMI
jgi:hypothetical protein